MFGLFSLRKYLKEYKKAAIDIINGRLFTLEFNKLNGIGISVSNH